MMPITLFKAISAKGFIQVKYAENRSKRIQPHDIDAMNKYQNIIYTLIYNIENTNNAVPECPGVSWGVLG